MLFDYNRDGKVDVFLVSAVVEGGKVRDLLLQNDGAGTFTDVTAKAGLATPRPSLGAAAGDYDNDGKPDLVVTGVDDQRLFRNKGDGGFEDVTAATGLDQLKGVCLGCSVGRPRSRQRSRLDHLSLCRHRRRGRGVHSRRTSANGGVFVFENIGVAPPAPSGTLQPALTTRFRFDDRFTVARGVPAVTVATTDFDSDRDVDLIVFADGQQPAFVENNRLMRFASTTPSWAKDKANALERRPGARRQPR